MIFNDFMIPKLHWTTVIGAKIGDGSLGSLGSETQEIESNMEGLPSKKDSELTEASDMWSGYVWFTLW